SSDRSPRPRSRPGSRCWRSRTSGAYDCGGEWPIAAAARSDSPERHGGDMQAMLRILFGAVLALAASAVRADEQLWERLRAGGLVLLMRHAETTPGTGDPPGFRLEDCATQRNLSIAGREQARAVGAALARRGVKIATVLSSPWCRARETAMLAF